MIRKAIAADAPRLAEVHVSAWRQAYRHFISEEFLFKTMSVEKRKAAFARAIENNLEETYVFEEASTVMGLLTIGDCRDEDKAAGTFELWGLYIDPPFQRRGIGSRLAAFCQAEAIKRGRREITLWVFEKNTGARRFYEEIGFAADGKRQLLEVFGEYEVRYVKKL